MPPIDPNKVLSPKIRIDKIIKVIHNGITSGTGFSIAKLLLKNKAIVLGIRYDISGWSPDPNKGFPTVRGHASWFILPNNFQNVFCNLSSDDIGCNNN